MSGPGHMVEYAWGWALVAKPIERGVALDVESKDPGDAHTEWAGWIVDHNVAELSPGQALDLAVALVSAAVESVPSYYDLADRMLGAVLAETKAASR